MQSQVHRLLVDFSEREAGLLNHLLRLGSVERVVTADEGALMQIAGIGPKKAARIRELVC